MEKMKKILKNALVLLMIIGLVNSNINMMVIDVKASNDEVELLVGEYVAGDVKLAEDGEATEYGEVAEDVEVTGDADVEVTDSIEDTKDQAIVTSPSVTNEEDGTSSYVVISKNSNVQDKVKQNYEKSENISEISEDEMANGNICSLELTPEQAESLEEQDDVLNVELDVSVSASGKKQFYKGRKTTKKKQNSSKREWNAISIKTAEKAEKPKDKKVKVAVIDSGVDAFNDIVLTDNINLIPGEEETLPLFIDITGHGSSVAGLIAAEDNGEGITGINPNVEMYSAKVMDETNTAPISRVVEGIYWAIDKNVNIINMSFGTTVNSPALERAVQDAQAAGILIVAAAGNDEQEGIEYPAAYEGVFAVGSVDSEGIHSENSAVGEELDIVAPGELINSTGGFGGEVVFSGTSMAAPQVAAVASIIWQKDLSMPAEFVMGLLRDSANSYGDKSEYGNGLVDAAYALSKYDEYKKEYLEKGQESSTELRQNSESITNIIEENVSPVVIYDDIDYVEGRWTGGDHQQFVQNVGNFIAIKEGAIYPDRDGAPKLGDAPWWHGGYNADNYIASYIYTARLAGAIRGRYSLDYVAKPSGSGNYSIILSDVKTACNNRAGNEDAAQFVQGMAIHTATDIFAHSVWANTVEYGTAWGHLNHKTKDNPNANDLADNTGWVTERYKTAQLVARASIYHYLKYEMPSFYDFYPSGGYSQAGGAWKVKGLSDNFRKCSGGSYLFYKLYNYTQSPSAHSYK